MHIEEEDDHLHRKAKDETRFPTKRRKFLTTVDHMLTKLLENRHYKRAHVRKGSTCRLPNVSRKKNTRGKYVRDFSRKRRTTHIGIVDDFGTVSLQTVNRGLSEERKPYRSNVAAPCWPTFRAGHFTLADAVKRRCSGRIGAARRDISPSTGSRRGDRGRVRERELCPVVAGWRAGAALVLRTVGVLPASNLLETLLET